METIKKPWAVYSTGIGKVVKTDSEGKVWITSFENGSPEWAPKKVQTFEDPVSVINYFFTNQSYSPKYSMQNIIHLFLD